MNNKILRGAGLALLAVVAARSQAQERPTIAVMGFANKTGVQLQDFDENAQEMLAIHLVNTGTFRVLERDKLKMVLSEQALSETVLLDDEQSMVRVGKLLGADYLFTGSVMSYDVKGSKFSGYGIETVNYVLSLKLSVKVIATNTGEIVYGKLTEETRSGRMTSTAATFDTGANHELLEAALSKAVSGLGEFALAHPGLFKKGAGAVQLVAVRFTSTPPGADVAIDGAVVGTTPLQYKLADGVHKVVISLGGHETWERQVRLKAGSAINAVLKKIKEKDGDLHIIIEERKR